MNDTLCIPTDNTLPPHGQSPIFEVIDEEEAGRRLLSVQSADMLVHYRSDLEAGLAAVQQGKRFHVRSPLPQAANLKILQRVIQQLAQQEPFHIEVRFDRATEGFIVRQATPQEQQQSAERRQALTAAREAQQQTQHHVAQSIMAQPDVPEDVETTPQAEHAESCAEPDTDSSLLQQKTLSPGAEEGGYEAQQAR